MSQVDVQNNIIDGTIALLELSFDQLNSLTHRSNYCEHSLFIFALYIYLVMRLFTIKILAQWSCTWRKVYAILLIYAFPILC